MKENWQYKKLGEVCEISSARRVHQSDWKDNGVPFYRAREIVKLSNEGHVDNELFISEELFDKLSKSGIPKEGDLMISAVGTLGATYIVKATDRFYYKDASVICISKIKNLKSEYLRYLFSSNLIIEQILKQSQGATVGTITISNAKNFIIPVPPLSVQERIVAELDLLSGIIEKQKQQLKELDTLAQSIFYSMFGDPITNEKNWPLKKLGEVTITPNKLENKQINSELLVSFLPMEDVKIDSIYQIPKQSKKLSELTKGSYNYFSNQDVLLAKVTPCFENGKCCVVKDLINQIGFGSSELIAFRCQESLLPVYLYFYFHSPTFISNGIKNLSGTSGLRRIQKNYLQKVSISVPPLDLQNEFAEKIEKIEKQKEAINKSIEETQKLFDYTMDKYFG